MNIEELNKEYKNKMDILMNEYKEKVKYQGVKTETTHKQQHNKTAVKISSRKRESARNTQKQNIYKGIEDERID